MAKSDFLIFNLWKIPTFQIGILLLCSIFSPSKKKRYREREREREKKNRRAQGSHLAFLKHFSRNEMIWQFGLFSHFRIWPFWNGLWPNLAFLFIETWQPWKNILIWLIVTSQKVILRKVGISFLFRRKFFVTCFLFSLQFSSLFFRLSNQT